MDFPGSASDKEPTCQCRRYGFNTWVGKIPWRRACNPLQYSSLENPKDRGAWQTIVHGVAQSWTQLKRLSTHIGIDTDIGIGTDIGIDRYM